MRYRIYIAWTAIVFASLLFCPAMAVGQSAASPAESHRQARLFDEHVVRMGETTFSIARGYAISLPALIEDNPDIDPKRLRTGQVLLIRKRERGKTPPRQVTRQWAEFTRQTKPGGTGTGTGQGASENGNDAPEEDMQLQPEPWNDSEPERGSGREFGQESEWTPDERIGMYAPRTQEGVPSVAIMLPFEGTGGQAARDIVDFYRGALLAFEDEKAGGRSMDVALYDSGRSEEKVMETVRSSEFSDVDLIIGPIYESEMAPALQYAEAFDIPMVSPLVPVIRDLDSNSLYQMAPDPATKYDKLRDVFESAGSDKNIVLVSSGKGDDVDFEREMVDELGAGNYGRFVIGSESIASIVDWERPNVFIVLAGTESGVDGALTSISSAYNNASERRSRKADITVVGSSRWANYDNLDKNLFFSLNVRFVTSYYINNLDEKSASFERRYLSYYGDFPSRAAFRGYDAVALFAGALHKGTPLSEAFHERGRSFDAFDDSLEKTEAETVPLNTSYRFVQKEGGNHVNDLWTLVKFTSGYDIIVE